MTKLINNKLKKVAVGLSGGVDSSVTAYLLKEQGYEVTGVHLMCWDYKADGCSGEEDRADAVKVADHLGIPFKTLDFEKTYREKVISNFYSEYKAGRTPNPDVLCNKEIKFGLFLTWAMEQGFDYIATGHYARISQDNGLYNLLKGIDLTKDQSYFLYLINQKQLSHTLFPIGDMLKEDVRTLAVQIGLHNANKPDSVGICFIGDIDIKEFLKKELPLNSGSVVNVKGEVIGQHDGVAFYTIGQRHGFKINVYQGLPLYVISKNIEKNELVVGFAKEGQVAKFNVKAVSWINEDPGERFNADVRIRHLGELYPAEVVKSFNNGSYSVKLEVPVFGVAPGQSAVFYVGSKTLGGGIIV